MLKSLSSLALAGMVCLMASLSWPQLAQAGRVPQSGRSRTAMTHVTPQLKKDLQAKGMTLGSPVYLRMFKEENELELWIEVQGVFERFETLAICNYGGRGPGPKEKEGDGRAPEGFYYVTPAQFNPYSNFHLAFNLGYPNRYDIACGRTGSALMVHGQCCSIGCYAMTDSGIDRIWTLCCAALDSGQPFFRVHIFPFRMTQENMVRHRNSPWFEFWKNLKEGYDWFANHKQKVPNVKVYRKHYTFQE